MSKKVSTSQVLFIGLVVTALILCCIGITKKLIQENREKKAIAHLEQINAPKEVLCDHGTACTFKTHCDHMWCEKHQMYHHRDRVCMHDQNLEKLEDQLIKAREQELGFKKVTKPVKYKPDIEMNKRK